MSGPISPLVSIPDQPLHSHRTHALFLSQIFYPENLFQSYQQCDCYLIGWNLDNFRCFIACCVPISSAFDLSLGRPVDMLGEDQQFKMLVERALEYTIEDLRECIQYCSSCKPIVLGKWKHNISDSYIPTSAEQGSSIWITISIDKSEPGCKPILNSVYSLGSIYFTSSYMIEYVKMNTDELEFMMLESFTDANTKRKLPSPLSRVRINGEYTRNQASSNKMIADVGTVIRHVNTAHDLDRTLVYHIDILTSSSSTISQIDDKTFQYNKQNKSIVSFLLLYMSYLFDSLSNVFLNCLQSKHLFSWWSIGRFLANWVGLRGNDGIGSDSFILGISLSEISLSSVHVQEKLILFKLLILQTIIFVKSWSRPASERSLIWRDILRILAFLWFDTVIGLIVGWIVLKNQSLIRGNIQALYNLMEKKYLQDAIEWFNHNPGGVKLNSVITRRIGLALRYLIRLFEHVITVKAKFLHRPSLVLVACVGSLGFTVQSMIVIDIVRLATLHISTLHRCFGYQHKYQLEIISSLYHLFYGKKKNILRKRIDTCEYDSHQLLFGIALFVMVIFLFPTFAAYFYLFAILNLMVVLGNYVLWIFVVCMKEFPYYSFIEIAYFNLSMYIYRPWKSQCHVDGIQFQLLRIKNDETTFNGILQSTHIPKTSKSSSENIPSAMKSSLSKKLSNATSNESPVSPSSNKLTSSKSNDKNKKDEKNYMKWKSFGIDMQDQRQFALNLLSSMGKRSSALFSRDRNYSYDSDSETSRLLDTQSSKDSLSKSPLEGETTSSSVREGISVESPSPMDADSNELAFMQTGSVDSFKQKVVRFKDEASNEIIDPSAHKIPSIDVINPPISIASSKHAQAVRLLAARRSPPSSTSPSMKSSPGSTIFLKLSPKSYSLAQFYLPYARYWEYFVKEEGLVWRLLKGMVHGRPSLDIQLIRATTDLSSTFRHTIDVDTERYLSIPRHGHETLDENQSSAESTIETSTNILDYELTKIDFISSMKSVLFNVSENSPTSYNKSSRRKRGLTELQRRRNRFLVLVVLVTCSAMFIIVVTAIFLFITLSFFPDSSFDGESLRQIVSSPVEFASELAHNSEHAVNHISKSFSGHRRVLFEYLRINIEDSMMSR